MTARSPDWHRDHGSLVPVTLSLKCDVPGCKESFSSTEIVRGALEELPLSARIKAEAELNGWYVARDRGAKNQNWDLCPGCAGAAAIRNVGRMR
jgi:hypothetical protein